MRLPPPLLLLLLAACHSEPFGPFVPDDVATLGAGSGALGAPLTFNPYGDTDAAWTADGRHLLYTYSDGRGERCLGLLPAEAPRRVWSLCDHRVQRLDSVPSFPTAAIRDDGALLYLQSMSRRREITATLSGGLLAHEDLSLWLADTASPLASRRRLLRFPVGLGDQYIERIARAQWTGPDAFLALGQTITYIGVNPDPKAPEILFDTVLTPIGVFRGTISGAGATLTEVPGTHGATAYAIAGARLVWATPDRRVVARPLDGGTPDTVAVLPEAIADISCAATHCAVATWSAYVPKPQGYVWSIWRLDLTTGAFVRTHPFSLQQVLPRIALSPVTGDLVFPRVTSIFRIGAIDIYSFEGLRIVKGAMP